MEHVIRGTVPLTEALVENKVDLDPTYCVPYLRKNLKWVIQKGHDSVPVKSLKSLKVGVSSSIVEYPEDYRELPKWTNEETHYDITYQRDGGLQYNDTYLVKSEEAPTVISNTTISQDPGRTGRTPLRRRLARLKF